jgi:hypothetical protein
MRKRRNVAWLVALAIGLMLVPAMDAAAAGRAAAREQAQNHRISRVIKQARLTALKVASVSQTLGNTNKLLGEVGQKVINLTTVVSGIDGRLKFIEGAAPVIIQGLTDLKAGLTKLGDAYTSVEYGRAGIFPSGAATPTLAAGGSVTSADIPDDGNAITTGENAIVVAGASGAMAIDLKAAIRSNESDGDSASKTAGQAGGFLYVTNLDTGARVACVGAPNPPGIIGTTPGDSIVTPSGTVNTLPLKNIPGGVLRTDTSKPDSSSTSLLPAACQFGAAAGTTYQVRYSVNFLDIPTSTTPGPKE